MAAPHKVMHVVRLFGQANDRLAGFLPSDPFQMAGLPPIREILLGNGPAVEVVVQDLLDLGQLIEPGEDFGAGESVFEAMAELIAKGGGETADFTCGS
jgi:hypothetical protein